MMIVSCDIMTPCGFVATLQTVEQLPVLPTARTMTPPYSFL